MEACKSRSLAAVTVLIFNAAAAWNPSGTGPQFALRKLPRTILHSEFLGRQRFADVGGCKRSSLLNDGTDVGHAPESVARPLLQHLELSLTSSLEGCGDAVRAQELVQELLAVAPVTNRSAWMHKTGEKLSGFLRRYPELAKSISETKVSALECVRRGESFREACHFDKRAIRHTISEHHHALQSTPQAWNSIVSNQTALQRYGEAAMHVGTRKWVRVGIDWCADTIKEHFHNGRAAKRIIKDLRTKHFLQTGCPMQETVESHLRSQVVAMTEARISPVHLLDVGSCGYLFEGLQGMKCTALDLCPQDERTHRADFLDLHIGPRGSRMQVLPPQEGETCAGELLAVPEASYDAVVFSLVMSYLQQPSQRVKMVANARKLLVAPARLGSVGERLPGLLLIVDTLPLFKEVLPDWVHTIESLGFRLVKHTQLYSSRALAFEAVPVDDGDFESLDEQSQVMHLMTKDERDILQSAESSPGAEMPKPIGES